MAGSKTATPGRPANGAPQTPAKPQPPPQAPSTPTAAAAAAPSKGAAAAGLQTPTTTTTPGKKKQAATRPHGSPAVTATPLAAAAAAAPMTTTTTTTAAEHDANGHTKTPAGRRGADSTPAKAAKAAKAAAPHVEEDGSGAAGPATSAGGRGHTQPTTARNSSHKKANAGKGGARDASDEDSESDEDSAAAMQIDDDDDDDSNAQQSQPRRNKSTKASNHSSGTTGAVASDATTEYVTRLGGGNITRFPAVFSKDGKFMFAAAGDLVNVYSVNSGERVRCLQTWSSFNAASTDSESSSSSTAPKRASGSGAPAIALWLNPANALQLFSVTSDARLLVWDINDGVLLQQLQLALPAPFPKRRVIAAVPLPDSPYAMVYIVYTPPKHLGMLGDTQLTSAAKATAYFQDLAQPTSTTAATLSTTTTTTPTDAPSKPATLAARKIFKSKALTKLAISGDGVTVAAIGGRYLHVYNLRTETGHKFKHARDLTCVAIHPTEAYIATGDSRGEIVLWYLQSESMQQQGASRTPATSVMHWHANAVAHMCFSSDGVYLISGGLESVLVMWQLQTGHRQYLPRLGAAITAVATSADDTLYAVSHADNSIRIVSAVSLKTLRIVQSLKLGERDSAPVTGLVVEPRTNMLVLNSTLPGTIQFFDAHHDRHVTDIEIVPRHHVTSTPVVHVAFGRGGEWMATIERREDIPSLPKTAARQFPGSTLSSPAHYSMSAEAQSSHAASLSVLATPDATFETRLRFWHYNKSAQRYVLSTCAESPHGISAVSSIQFHPKLDLAVTCGLDKKFRVWALASPASTDSYVASTAAAAAAAAAAASASSGTTAGATAPAVVEEDVAGSWFCRSVGFYRDYHCKSLAFSADGSVLAIAYGSSVTLWDVDTSILQITLSYPPPQEHIQQVAFINDTPYLVARSSTSIYVWNLLTCSVWWSCKLNTSALVLDASSDRFMVFTTVQDPANRKAQQQRVLLFRPMSAVPVSIFHIQDSRRVTAAAFVPTRKGGLASVVYLGDENDLKMLHTSGPVARKASALVPLAANKPTVQQTSYAQLFGSTPSTDAAPAAATAAASSSTSAAAAFSGKSLSATIFSGPAHVIPPVSQLVGPFMGLLLDRVTGKVATAESTTSSAMDTAEDVPAPAQPQTAAVAPRSLLAIAASVGEREFDFLADCFKVGATLTDAAPVASRKVRKDKS
ncbi:hypothetical protein CAOG_08091 [Capsaspora owczarzaki ATCC 30864]|uniref:WD repeat-containing protein 75 second beta-propeller domain-containing protein n=1 Tax=Capsaspora owczarzaki (strain ATCC 30864) TaxID=595528 RepID=A0A0D2USX4_CAPO3|nr:hypothetical protein CAOG_08091 [Capsaspora owczarzaki ATCC 30864]KJE98056.1 hypothetical protein CAOG_008091 [Capsaspora owczarzaki ATCC 30864]|eukprot:XP_004342692.1 hypothetical protein CAOG_08091 [Capsaspora owczarzaki ATCC 30864]